MAAACACCMVSDHLSAITEGEAAAFNFPVAIVTKYTTQTRTGSSVFRCIRWIGHQVWKCQVHRSFPRCSLGFSVVPNRLALYQLCMVEKFNQSVPARQLPKNFSRMNLFALQQNKESRVPSPEASSSHNKENEKTTTTYLR